MPLHTDRAFEEQLGQLRTAVLEMGGLVEEQIGQAVPSSSATRRSRAPPSSATTP